VVEEDFDVVEGASVVVEGIVVVGTVVVGFCVVTTVVVGILGSVTGASVDDEDVGVLLFSNSIC